MLKKISSYFSLVKFSHTIFALPFAMIGFFLAVVSGSAQFSAFTLVMVLVCMVMARSAAMAFNRYVDREFDALNPRTVVREIPSGQISPRSALLLVIGSSLVFVAATYFINPLCFYLSPAALVVILGYSYTKRFTALCHLVLGLGLALAPIGAYIALTAQFAVLPLLLSVLVFFWVSGFDIIYALQDDAFDKSQQLNSIPVLLGRKNALLLSRVFHVAVVCLLALIYFVGPFGNFYVAGACVFTGLLLYQHRLVKPNDLSKVNLAFGTTNGIASVAFSLFVCCDMYLHA